VTYYLQVDGWEKNITAVHIFDVMSGKPNADNTCKREAVPLHAMDGAWEERWYSSYSSTSAL
jgi:hypothetical protein